MTLESPVAFKAELITVELQPATRYSMIYSQKYTLGMAYGYMPEGMALAAFFGSMCFINDMPHGAEEHCNSD